MDAKCCGHQSPKLEMHEWKGQKLWQACTVYDHTEVFQRFGSEQGEYGMAGPTKNSAGRVGEVDCGT